MSRMRGDGSFCQERLPPGTRRYTKEGPEKKELPPHDAGLPTSGKHGQRVTHAIIPIRLNDLRRG
jgi:hypothetical protein